jgi:RNA polymerase sigma factor (TIGR02999 family)
VGTQGENALEALLDRVRAGDQAAASDLFTEVYGELRALAGSLFRSQKASHTLQPTAVVHEAYVKMLRAAEGGANWRDRAHFFNVAAKAMRQVLVNHARDAQAHKRGGPEQQRVTLDDADGGEEPRVLDILAVHQALEELSQLDERQARMAELRFFAGLSNKEIAEVLGVALRTVELDWKMAKTWLAGRLGPDAG